MKAVLSEALPLSISLKSALLDHMKLDALPAEFALSRKPLTGPQSKVSFMACRLGAASAMMILRVAESEPLQLSGSVEVSVIT